MKSFKDYVKDRKITEAELSPTKPKVKLVADYDGPTATTPDQGKNSSPYKPANGEEKPKKGEKGFADLGGKELVYNPDTKGGDSKNTSLGKEVKKNWPKLKSESWFEKTKNMNQSEFLKFMNEECGCGAIDDDGLPTVNAYSAGPFHPYPPEAIKYVVVLGNKNPKILSDLVHEVKRSGGLGTLLKALLDHPESYDSLTDLFGDDDGPRRSRSFAKSMNDKYSKFLDDEKNMWEESVGPPMGLGDDDEDEDDRPLDPTHNDEEFPDDDEGFDEPSDEDDEEFPDDEGFDEPSDEEGEPSDEDDEDNEEFPDDEGFDEPSDEKMTPPSKTFGKEKKLKKKFAHNHILDSMASFEPMMKAMMGYK